MPKPLLVIEPRRSWVALNLREVWESRELLYFLAWRDVKIRYKQTIFGAAWAIIQPLATMIVFTYFLGKLARIPAEDIPYPLFFYSGLTLWTFFSNSIFGAANSLVGNPNLITKIYFPRLVIPLASIGAGLVDFAIASLLLIVLLIHYRVPITPGFLMIFPLMLLTTFLAVAIGIWLSAINVRYRDVRYALPFIIQLWLFVSPIMYPTSLVPEEWRWGMVLNPLTGLIEGYRSSICGRAFNWPALLYSAAFATVMAIYGSYTFRRMEKHFAEFI